MKNRYAKIGIFKNKSTHKPLLRDYSSFFTFFFFFYIKLANKSIIISVRIRRHYMVLQNKNNGNYMINRRFYVQLHVLVVGKKLYRTFIIDTRFLYRVRVSLLNWKYEQPGKFKRGIYIHFYFLFLFFSRGAKNITTWKFRESRFTTSSSSGKLFTTRP